MENQYNVIACRGLTVTNWSDTFRCNPEIYFMPRDVEEIREIILLATANKKKVRVVGRCHSPSDLALCNEYMISLKFLNRVLSVDQSTGLVKAEAGITLFDLNHHLQLHGLAMPVLGSVSDVTLGGVINTASHGSGATFTVMSGYVEELELLTSSGDLIKYSKSSNKDVYYSALCGLGSIGIIITVVIRCEPAFLLYQRQTPSTLDQVLEDLEDHLSNSEHFRFLWFPHTNYVSLSHIHRVPGGQAVLPLTLTERISSWLLNYGIGYYSLEFAYWLSTFFPWITPWINRLIFWIQYGRETEKIDVSYKIFNFECLFKQHVYEWSVPREKTQVVLSELQRFLDSNPTLFVHFPVEVRFVAADDIYLSPAFGRDSCYINVICYRPYGKEVEYRRWFNALERIAKESGGRPHWAKAHGLTAEDFVKMYPCFRQWAQTRRRLDPINIFFNDYMARIFATFPKE